jgi:hypothetical protein
LADLVRPRDLAHYLVICTLLSLPRREIRESILSAPGFKSLMDHIGAENEDVIENYLNGRYKEF